MLKRVGRDPNFRHYMLGTESLTRCLRAQAERLGLSEEAIAKIDSFTAMPPPVGDGCRRADVVILRERLAAVNDLVADLQLRGKLSEDDYRDLTEAIQCRSLAGRAGVLPTFIGRRLVAAAPLFSAVGSRQ